MNNAARYFALRSGTGFLGRYGINKPMRVVNAALASCYDDKDDAESAADAFRSEFPDVRVVPGPTWNATTKRYDNDASEDN